MQKRVLVAYASKAGSTAEVAEKIGQAIARKDLLVDVLPVQKVKDVREYHAIVLGSGIRVGQVLPEMLKFIQNNQAVLQQKPVNVFVVCMTLNVDTEANRQAVSAYLDPVRALVTPASEGLFAGSLDVSRLGIIERLMLKAMKTPQGDFRQWDQIETWAERVVAQKG